MFDRKLIDYLPPVLQSVMEFTAITDAQQPEIEAAWDALDCVMNNQFIDTATEAGVIMWEKELNIIPLTTDTLDDRKQRIKTAWTYGVVYTYNWLKQWLKIYGKDNSLPTIDGYVLHAFLSIKTDYISTINNIRRYVPSNIIIEPLIRLTSARIQHFAGSALRIGMKQTMQSDQCNLTQEGN